MGSGSCVEENEKWKEAGKGQVYTESLKAGDHCETTCQAVHNIHNRTTHP